MFFDVFARLIFFRCFHQICFLGAVEARASQRPRARRDAMQTGFLSEGGIGASKRPPRSRRPDLYPPEPPPPPTHVTELKDRFPSVKQLKACRDATLAHARACGATDVEPIDVRVVAAPYRVCPLGAHIDHQGGTVAGVALNCGVLLGFVPAPTEVAIASSSASAPPPPPTFSGAPATPPPKLTPTTVSLTSDAREGDVRFDLRAIPPPRGAAGCDDADDWGAYARGVARALEKFHADGNGESLARGILGRVEAHPPGLDRAGLASSAALEVAIALALESANAPPPAPVKILDHSEHLRGADGDFYVEEDAKKAARTFEEIASLPKHQVPDPEKERPTPTRWDIARVGRACENDSLGLRSGVLDQATCACAAPGALTLIDCASETDARVIFDLDDPTRWHKHWSPDELTEPILEGKGLPIVFLIAHSGVRESLAGTGYGDRVEECHAAAEALTAAAAAAAAGEEENQNQKIDAMEASSSGARRPRLGDVPAEVFERWKDRLTETERKRATHFFSEQKRVHDGCKAWRAGDLETFGRLVNASGASSIENYDAGCPPMNDLLEICRGTPNVLGARFSGAGFRGCCVAICLPEHAKTAADAIRDAYVEKRPEHEKDAVVVVAKSAKRAREYYQWLLDMDDYMYPNWSEVEVNYVDG